MRRGLVGVDWAIGIGIFLIFVAISFAYYSSLFPPADSPLAESADYAAGQILDYIKVDVHDVPVMFSSPSIANDQVLYLNYTWPFGKNSTRVYSGGTSLPCYISGDTLYWEADLASGDNHFIVRYSNQSLAMRCASSLSLSQVNRTLPWAAEPKRLFAQSRIDAMAGMPYQDFMDEQDLNRDFSLYINDSGTVTQYGKNPPNSTSVVAVRRWGIMEGTGNNVEARILVW